MFVRPGQVRAELPAPDQCIVCGAPEASHTVRPDSGGWISGSCRPAQAQWHVLVYDGTDTTSYVIAADDEVSAAAMAGAQHGGPVDGCEVEPWTAS